MMYNDFNNNGANNNHNGRNGGFMMATGTIKTKEVFAETVKTVMDAVYGNECKVRVQEVTKNNSLRLTGLTILSRGSNLAPTIYLDGFYQDYRNGKNMEDICQKIMYIYENSKVQESMDVAMVTDFAKVKDRICFKLVNAEKNTGLLKNAPHRKYQDLAVIFYILVSKDSDSTATITVKNPLLEMWGVDADVLYQVAKDNTQRIFRGSVSSMLEVLAGTISDNADTLDAELVDGFFDMAVYEDSAFPMYVATNTQRLNGAGVILYDGLLEQFAKEIGGDFYILPSSVHEVLFIPAVSGMDAEELVQMVREVNVTQVMPEEVLSDSVYLYHADKDFVEKM